MGSSWEIIRSGLFLGTGRSQEYQVMEVHGVREVMGVSRGHWVIGPGHTSSHSVPLTMKASHSRHLAGPLSRRSRWVWAALDSVHFLKGLPDSFSSPSPRSVGK